MGSAGAARGSDPAAGGRSDAGPVRFPVEVTATGGARELNKYSGAPPASSSFGSSSACLSGITRYWQTWRDCVTISFNEHAAVADAQRVAGRELRRAAVMAVGGSALFGEHDHELAALLPRDRN